MTELYLNGTNVGLHNSQLNLSTVGWVELRKMDCMIGQSRRL